jgi:DNA-binding transcriptional regulator YdaS (Cro superfamily)
MKTIDMVTRYGSQAELARALGVSRAAVNAWGEDVPPLRQLQLQAITNGEIQPDADVYEQISKRHRKEPVREAA